MMPMRVFLDIVPSLVGNPPRATNASTKYGCHYSYGMLTILVGLILGVVHQLELLQVSEHLDEHLLVYLGDFTVVKELIELLKPLLVEVVPASYRREMMCE